MEPGTGAAAALTVTVAAKAGDATKSRTTSTANSQDCLIMDIFFPPWNGMARRVRSQRTGHAHWHDTNGIPKTPCGATTNEWCVCYQASGPDGTHPTMHQHPCWCVK